MTAPSKDDGNGLANYWFLYPGIKLLNGPGVCGDPFLFSFNETFYSGTAGASQATYTPGQAINVQWWIQENHGGRIGVKLCPRRHSLDQACFDQHPLQRADGLGPFVYIMNGTSKSTLGTMSADFRLPAGVACAGGCVLQWEYLTMNSCYEACDTAACGVYADRHNPVTGQGSMGTCCLGSESCSVADIPEVFRNCADITITTAPSGPMQPPSPTP
ncbi:hypothetical protein OEZ86_000702 [Tetradesmus obliquus]|nr:hypothetical protein OEZ86_000702 [Tetradesmus obliquus]